MRLPLIALAAVLASLSSAPAAWAIKIAPPGNSGISQYVENVPGATGNVPSLTIHAHPSSGATTESGAVGPATQQVLASHGTDGAQAAALANATAPAGVHGVRGVHRRHRSGGAAGGRGAGGQGPGGNAPTGATPVSGSVVSPTSAVLKAVTGSATHGLGALLPVILVVSALGAGLLATIRRRRAT